jgi:type II secretion system protein L
LEKPAIDEIRILLGVGRASVAHDHVWCRLGDATLRLLDELPAGDHYVVVVPTQRVSLFRVTPPPGPRRKVEAALPFLIEERLLEPIERYEVWPLWPAAADAAVAPGEGTLWLAVLERDWLSGVRSALARIGEGDVRWVLAGWGWEAAERSGESATPSRVWRLRGEGSEVVFNQNGVDPRLLPLASLPQWLDLAWAQSGAGERPKAIEVDFTAVTDAAAAASIEHFAQTHQLALHRVPLPAPLHADYSACPYTLLRQTRSAWRREWYALFCAAAWPRWRPLAFAALALIGLELAAPAVLWGSLSIEQSRLRSEAFALYREVAGPQATIVDPLLQMRRAYQEQRHAAGKLVADDFLPQLASVSAVLPPTVRQFAELAYENSRLRIVVPATPGLSLRSLGDDFRAAGWLVNASASSDNSRWTFVVSAR